MDHEEFHSANSMDSTPELFRENFFSLSAYRLKNAIENLHHFFPCEHIYDTSDLGKQRGITNKNGSKVFVQILYLFINKAAKLHALRESIFIALATTKHDKITEFRLDKKIHFHILCQ